jgi:spore coat polysaccharide biosynthesis protein SpsF
VDEVIATYFHGEHDFCMLSGSFPVGLDTTVYAYEALQRCHREARRLSEREHIFPYITSHPELFDIGLLDKPWGKAHLRWVMDHEVDYRFVASVYAALYRPGEIFLSRDILELLDDHPELAGMNAGIPRDEGIREAVRKERAMLS